MRNDDRIPEPIVRLLVTSIESVERLDVLLYLRAAPTKTFSARAIANARRTPIAAAEQHLAILCGRGFLTVTIGSDLLYAYQPVSPSLGKVLDEIAKLSEERREDVVAALTKPVGRDPVRAFADAFLLRDPEENKGRKGKG